MLFTDPLYFLFFGLVFLVYWGARRHGFRKAWLLVASYAFYAAWDWRFSFLILGSTIVDFAAGAVIGRARSRGKRRAALLGSLGANLGILGFFKYYDFFVTSACSFLARLGLQADPPTLGLILPVGISFFTFQTMSYTIDVYRGKMRPVRSFPDFALYVSFFPQLVAGPIVRARTFLPQLETKRSFASVDLRACLGLFFVGLFKKAVVANNLALWIDPVFASPELYDAFSVRLAAVLFAVQIYCDFSGYTDMAIASGELLGFRFPRNFAFPFLARDVSEAWGRWHMSLTSWLRDYVLTPLCGRCRSKWAVWRAVFVTLLLCGLWHGAGWNYIAWGGLHGAALLVHSEWRRRTRGHARLDAVMAWLGAPIAFSWGCFTFLFFRGECLTDAVHMAGVYLGVASGGLLSLDWRIGLCLPPLVLLHVDAYRGWSKRLLSRMPDTGLAAAYGAATPLVLFFAPLAAQPFLYFQF